MRHLIQGRHLNRKPPHRIAMLRNMSCSLFAHERIVTTVAKAKELRRHVEKLITLAKRGVAEASTKEPAAGKLVLLHIRRLLMARLGGKKSVPIDDKTTINVVDKLLKEIAPRYASRPGGYCRIIKRSVVRLGDAAPTAIIELVDRPEPTAPAPEKAKEKEKTKEKAKGKENRPAKAKAN